MKDHSEEWTIPRILTIIGTLGVAAIVFAGYLDVRRDRMAMEARFNARPLRTVLEQVIVVAKHDQGTPSVEVKIAGDGPWYKLGGSNGSNKMAHSKDCVMWSVNVPVGADVMLISFQPDSHKETWIGLDTGAKDK